MTDAMQDTGAWSAARKARGGGVGALQRPEPKLWDAVVSATTSQR